MKKINFPNLYSFILTHLKNHDIDDHVIEASILLNYFISEKKIIKDTKLSVSNQSFLLEIIKKRALGFPIQYITEEVNFYKSKFYVNENVLIPRPETEILIEKCIEFIRKNEIKNPNIIDIGTGSGSIAISIAKEISDSRIYAVDISKDAIDVAKINANNNDVIINFVQGNLFANIDCKFDIVISNPPYIRTENIKNLQKEVLYEPVLALDGGIDGMSIISKIINKGINKISKHTPSGIFIEIDPQVLSPLEKILSALPSSLKYNITNDYSGYSRILSITT
ncbi:MAG: protein-(glutamine-N5) methyltransferase, release factor-specific [Chloroflexi bacterium]|nr:protein-(glutamine-N5) methyltransferase, release factor-specific [Chloroflexota bacterium]